MSAAHRASGTSGSDTRARLIEAAMSEFIEHGFAGTDTNRIARRAGFAPQTFYRWFDDKAAVFAQVLHVWDEAEFAMLAAMVGEGEAGAGGLSPLQLAEACVENMRPFLIFRQHLRTVTMQDAAVRQARARGRAGLLVRLSLLCPHLPPDELAHAVLQIESISEMLARGDHTDLGAGDGVLLRALAEQIAALQGPRASTITTT